MGPSDARASLLGISFHGRGIRALCGCLPGAVARFARMVRSRPKLQSPGSMDRMVSSTPMVPVASCGQQQPVSDPTRCEHSQSCFTNPFHQSQTAIPRLDENLRSSRMACRNFRRSPLLQRHLLQGGGMVFCRPHAGVQKSLRALPSPQSAKDRFCPSPSSPGTKTPVRSVP